MQAVVSESQTGLMARTSNLRQPWSHIKLSLPSLRPKLQEWMTPTSDHVKVLSETMSFIAGVIQFILFKKFYMRYCAILKTEQSVVCKKKKLKI